MIETSCLSTREGHPIPLRGVAAEGEVVGGLARVRVRQQYRNEESRPIEAIYVFPLPADATLVGFVMECAGRRLEGVVQEREQAFATYDEAMVQGHGAALLEQERANVFTANVGNLLPGEDTVVEVTYVQRVPGDEGALRFCLPTLVAPRYIPGTPAGDRTAHGAADPTTRVPDADRISPAIDPSVAYRLALDLVFRVGTDVTLRSPSHAIEVQREAGGARVSFRGGPTALDRDLVIVAEGEQGPIEAVAAHREGERGTVALTLVPELVRAEKRASRGLSVVFVVDRSGSMGGASMDEAKKALRLCLRQLREGDRFSILAFDDRVEAFRDEPVPFTQKTLELADRWIEGVDARGGTELREPLLTAVRLAQGGLVVLLTDGQVGNEDEIARDVLAAAGDARVYPFGIGTNVSDALLRTLARKTGGALEMIHPGERVDEKVVTTFARALAARVRHVRVEVEGEALDDLAPAELPDLIDGEPWTLFARYGKAGPRTIHVRGTLDGAPYTLTHRCELPERADAPAVVALWAAERVRDLELVDVTDVSERRARAMKDRIVALAVEHRIASRYTSFVVVETRTGERKTHEAAAARPVPVNAPAGWAMFQAAAPAAQGFGGGGFRGRAFVGAAPGAPPMPMAMPLGGAMPPPPSPAAPAPMASGSADHKRKMAPKPSMIARAKAAIFGEGGAAEAKGGARAEDLLSEAAYDGGAFEKEAALAAPEPSGDPLFDLLSRQRASGAFSDGADALAVTVDALFTLLSAGVTTAHPKYGEQVRKAVEALLVLVAKAPPADVERALVVAFLVSTGRRTRRAVEQAIRATIPALSSRLLDEAALRAGVGAPAA